MSDISSDLNKCQEIYFTSLRIRGYKFLSSPSYKYRIHRLGLTLTCTQRQFENIPFFLEPLFLRNWIFFSLRSRFPDSLLSGPNVRINAILSDHIFQTHMFRQIFDRPEYILVFFVSVLFCFYNGVKKQVTWFNHGYVLLTLRAMCLFQKQYSTCPENNYIVVSYSTIRGFSVTGTRGRNHWP